MEHKNKILEELARTMINESSLPKYFWVDAICTTSYVLSKTIIHPIFKITPYELLKGGKLNSSHFVVFGM